MYKTTSEMMTPIGIVVMKLQAVYSIAPTITV